MPFRFLIVILLLAQYPVQAQLIDDFSDGEITSTPSWSGDVEDFIVNTDKQLQLNAAIAGTSLILAPIALADSAVWEFFYKMEFGPSIANRLQIYFMLDSDTISNANGYFIEIGENGSEDAVRLFRLDNGSPVEIVSSIGLFGGDPSIARIRIARDDQGTWSVFADLMGEKDYDLLFATSDTMHALSFAQFFGIACTYTDTRKDKFFFDDVFAGLPSPDTTSAVITDLQVSDELHLVVQFDEELDPTTALDQTHYVITPGIGAPAFVSFTDAMHHTIELALPVALQSHSEYSLGIDGVEDLAGNSTMDTLVFQYIRISVPDPYDILINEMMADPSPPLGLPNAEYIELYNRSDKTFQLENYALTVGSQMEFLPAKIMNPNSYVVLVDNSDSTLFGGIPNIVALDLPTLTNSGTSIELSDDVGNDLHHLTYDITSYQDASRDDGGWSLELINPLAPCLLASNLRASIDLTGGTPGRENSVTGNSIPDTEGPLLLRVFPENATHIQCIFDEVIIENAVLINLQPEHAFLDLVPNHNILDITIQTPLQSNTLYTLIIQEVSDCIGNDRVPQTQTFALPVSAEEGDLYINELLFDPQTGGSRFIEVINVSNKFLDLRELIVADIQGDTISAYPVETPFLCFPGAIVALTPDPQDILRRYFMHDPEQIIVGTLPAFNGTSGNATIYTRAGVVLDAFDYQADFHNALLDDAEGVSLERISTTLSTQSRETWYSASQTAGFATPGLPNSQRLPDFTGEGIIVIEPEIFSPDDDGTDDFLVIRFPEAVPGMLASIRVFDARGREVTRLAENVSIGIDSVIRWDGIDESGSKARIGAYVLWIELYGADGNVEHYKRTCILAERL